MMQIRKVYVLAVGIICAGLADAANVTYGTSANWSSKTVNDADTVIINGGATVALDTSDTATIVRVSNGLTDGTLKIDQNNTLTVLTDFQLGTSTGSGVVTQSAGTVTARHLQINQAGVSAASRYYLSGGQITSTGIVTVATNAQLNISGSGKMISSALTANNGGVVNLTGGVLDMAGTLTANGAVTINGGTVSNNIAGVGGAGRTIAGTDAIKMMSGNFILSGGGAVTDVVNINVAKLEVSGGTVDFGGQVRFASGTEVKVVGDAATISMFRINDLNTNTFRFVFDSTGISTINSAGYINVSNATIIVDGAAYAGVAGATFNLFNGTSLTGLAATNNISVSGFGAYGGAYVTQNALTGDIQLTVIPEPTTLGLFIVASGGLIMLRRLHR
jgi:hypothetical protein